MIYFLNIDWSAHEISSNFFSSRNLPTCPIVEHVMVYWFMVLNATFNNISVLLVEETRVPGENQRHVTNH